MSDKLFDWLIAIMMGALALAMVALSLTLVILALKATS